MKKNTNPLCPPKRRIYVSVVVSYLNFLACFYLALCAAFPSPIIMYEHQFRFMTTYNTYIKQLPKRRAAFSVELQGLEYYSEVVGAITEPESNFANEVKSRGNWKQAGYPKKDLDSLSALLPMANTA